MKKLTYWVAGYEGEFGASAFSARNKSKKSLIAMLELMGYKRVLRSKVIYQSEIQHSDPIKVIIEFKDTIDMIQTLMGEDGDSDEGIQLSDNGETKYVWVENN